MRCTRGNCQKHACFNWEGQCRAIFCSEHLDKGMVDVKHKRCSREGCDTRPSYNKPGETKGIRCAEHKEDGMVDVMNKKCIKEGCDTTPNYNKKGEKKGKFCVKHKESGMVNVTSKKCLNEECDKQPRYNKQGKKQPIYCTKHKESGMVNIKDRKCIYLECNKIPNFNESGKTQGKFCVDHKLPGMVDVKNKKCIEPECDKTPNFNEVGKKQGNYCVVHKLLGMVDVTHKTCKNSWCFTRERKKYEGFCTRCFIHMFPDKPVSRNYKTKEYAVVEYVKNTYSLLPWVADKRIDGGCSSRRPDLLLDLGYHVLIIEIDEDQHTDYDCSCENKRVMQLSQDVGHRPIVFIRFNPDDYIEEDKKITSCWGVNKQGICVIKKNKQREWNDRLESLKHQIEYWTNPDNKTDKTVEIIQLFYTTE